eukprot:3529621-Prymnesium_polylepis.1
MLSSQAVLKQAQLALLNLLLALLLQSDTHHKRLSLREPRKEGEPPSTVDSHPHSTPPTRQERTE